MEEPTDEQMYQRAHELWEEADKPEEAERELTQPDPALNPDEKSGTFTE